MRHLLVILALVLLTSLFATHLFAQDTLTLGFPLPLTGPMAKFGEAMQRGYEIAAEEINAAGGIKGKKVVLVFEDSQGRPEISRTIVEKLIDVKKQQIILAEYSSSCTKVIAAVAEERKVPFLIACGSADEICQQNYKYVVRLQTATAYYASGFLSFLKQVVKPKTFAILSESSDFGTAGADAMVKDVTNLGMKVLVKEQYEKGAVDFRPILSKIKVAKPDVIYMVSYVMDAALMMKQIKELRIDAKLFAGGAAGFAIPEFIQSAKDAAEYVMTATLWSPQVNYPGAKEFAEKYKAKYNDYPSYHSAQSHSCLYIAKDTLERAKSWTPDAIRDALKATNLMTVYGLAKFEDRNGYQGQTFIDSLVMQVIKGKHETIWPEKYASSKYVFPIPRWRDRK